MSAFEGKANLRFHCEMSANAHPIADMLQLYQPLQLGRQARSPDISVNFNLGWVRYSRKYER
jgi:hypothetical protein